MGDTVYVKFPLLHGGLDKNFRYMPKDVLLKAYKDFAAQGLPVTFGDLPAGSIIEVNEDSLTLELDTKVIKV